MKAEKEKNGSYHTTLTLRFKRINLTNISLLYTKESWKRNKLKKRTSSSPYHIRLNVENTCYSNWIEMSYYKLKLICSKQLFNVYENMQYTHKLLIANKHTKSWVATTKHSNKFKNSLKIEARGLCFYKQGKAVFWRARNLHSERENYAYKQAKACIFRLSWSFLSKPNSRRLRCWSRSSAIPVPAYKKRKCK